MKYNTEEFRKELGEVIAKSLEQLGDDVQKLPWFVTSVEHEQEEQFL